MGILEWAIVETPGSTPATIKELLNPHNQGSGINKIIVSPDGSTIWAIVRHGDRDGMSLGGAQVTLYFSNDNGRNWNDSAYKSLVRAQSSIFNGTFIWNIALAPDNPYLIAVACADIIKSPLAQEVWISIDGGNIWKNTNWPPTGVLQSIDLISAMDISADSNGHKILIGTRDGKGNGTNHLQMMTISGDGTWNIQDTSGIPPSTNTIIGDVMAVKFSPKFITDSTIVVVYTNGRKDHAGTWLATGTCDTINNSTNWLAREQHIEIRNSDGKAGDSPHINEIITAQLQLPFDFNGRDTNSRRYYISTDAVDRSGNFLPNRGIYRIDDKVIFTLMDNTDKFGSITSSTLVRRISSIAYFGTCKSGKLLAGEVLGFSSMATVPTWFTYSPEGQVEQFWFPSLKPTTGAARPLPSDSTWFDARGYGNAQVAWSPDGQLAFVATGAASLGTWDIPIVDNGAIIPALAWPAGYSNVVPSDESAFSLSRNNGETWNQLGMINTTITSLNDVAPTPDGITIYLASANCNELCGGFDSVWRSSSNPVVVSPLPVAPVGTYWERIFTHVSASSYQEPQSKQSILRLVPYCADPTGEIIGWAAQGTRAQAWSPDFGDYWSLIVPHDIIQDFCFESRSVLYNLSPSGLVQKIVNTGSGWSVLPSCDSGVSMAHTIAAYPEGKVLVGAAADYHRAYYAVSFSTTMNTENPKFQLMTAAGRTPFMGNVHVTFHPKFHENNTIFISDEAYLAGKDIIGGSVYRNNLYAQAKWENTDMLRFADAIVSSNKFNQQPQTGLVAGFTGEALYSCYVQWSELTMRENGGVLRTIDDGTGNYGPLSGIPQPGISWDYLDIFTSAARANTIYFGGQPTSLKACGCCSLNTDTTLYAIDSQEYAPTDKRGMLWSYTDCMAKKGPQLVTSGGITIGCDAVTGRNRTIEFKWEQLCIASDYQIQIASDQEFSAPIDTGIFRPALLSRPAFVYFGGGGYTIPSTIAVPGLECGQTYYWRCRAHGAINGAKLQSPWSEVRSFTIEDISIATISSRLLIPSTIKKVELKLPPGKKYHFFIAHASEDKDWAGPFAYYLHSAGFEVWYDEFEIKIGDSITTKIDEGLSQSQYGILILSHNFFKKDKTWTKKELGGLFALEDQEHRRLILPIWHNIGKKDVVKYSPILGDIVAANTGMDYKTVTDIILKAIST